MPRDDNATRPKRRGASTDDGLADATKATTLGRDPQANAGVVNPGVFRASTILYPSVDALRASKPDGGKNVHYGRYGTPTTLALTGAFAELEGAAGAAAVSSGKTAIVATLFALCRPGQRVLICDHAYGPTRAFADGMLKRYGVRPEYYDPRIGSGIAGLVGDDVAVVFCESPGSLTFEIQDVAAIARAAKAANPNVAVVMDNTWATPLLFKPLEHGCDVSINAATKYIGGHSDLMLGLIAGTAEIWPRLYGGVMEVAGSAGPDDCWLALRGLRTMAARLKRHHESAMIVANWLEARPEVARVLHPALPSHPDHALFERQFEAGSGLFAFVMRGRDERALKAMLDDMRLHGMGFSWGGFESLLIPSSPKHFRTAVPWEDEGQVLRIHVGLEDPDDLIRDLEDGLERWNAALG